MTEPATSRTMEFYEDVINAMQEEIAMLRTQDTQSVLGIHISDFESDLCDLLEPKYEPVDYPGQSAYSLDTCGVELNVTHYEAIPLQLHSGTLKIDDTNHLEFCAMLESVKWRITEGKTGVYALYTVKEI